MFHVLARIPVASQKSIASGLLYVAAFAAGFGALLIIGFQKATNEECSGILVWRSCTQTEIPLGDRVPALLGAISLVSIALVCVFLALRLFTLQGDLNRYLAILAGVETIPIQRIADITNSRLSKIRDDIQAMIVSGMITDFYIDYNNDQVVSKKYIPKTSYKTVVTCTGCGGKNELVVGITKTCNFCGQPLVLGTT